MSILSLDNVSLSYGTKDIIKNISFAINEGVKLGIIGINGAGKTTLLKLVTGEYSPSSGSVNVAKSAVVGMLKQHIDYDFQGKTVYDYAISAFASLAETERELEKLSGEMSADPLLIEKYNRIQYDFILKGGNEYKTKTRSLLARFSFRQDMYDFFAEKLSGGQKTRLALAVLLLSEPDIIVLDEPTNHLDIDTVEWLEAYIKASPKTFLIVSHDRYFLDKVTSETLELENLTSVKYTGSYSAFKEKKKAVLEAQSKHYELQQKEIKRLEAFIENQRKWNRERNIIAAESRQKAIDRMVKIEKPKTPPKSISIEISSVSASTDVLSVRKLSKAYNNEYLFSDLSFELKKGEKMFVIGANGCGKSTLLKILNGRVRQDNGIYELGYNQSIGYYDQEIQLLTDTNTVIDELLLADGEMNPAKARTFLASYGFSGDDVFKTIGVLSGGEKARLSIAKLVLNNVSLLILDEPTNHLDIPSKEILEQALGNYNGTLLAVSHDRYFISSLASRVLEIDKNGYQTGYFDFHGSFELFLAKRDKKALFAETPEQKESKLDYLSAKKEKGRRRSAEKRMEVLKNLIAELEEKQKLLELRLGESASDYKALSELSLEADAVTLDIEKAYEEYFELEEQLENAE